MCCLLWPSRRQRSAYGGRGGVLRSPQDAGILLLAVPVFRAVVAEPLSLLGDSAIVGRIGTTALGGLCIVRQALPTLVNVSIFLAAIAITGQPTSIKT